MNSVHIVTMFEGDTRKYYLKTWIQQGPETFLCTWDTNKKVAHNFMSTTDPSFELLLEYFASNHHTANITYVNQMKL